MPLPENASLDPDTPSLDDRGRPLPANRVEAALDEALDESFPASDPASANRFD